MATLVPIERSGPLLRSSLCTCRPMHPRRLHIVCRGTQRSDNEHSSKNTHRRALMMSATLIAVVGKGAGAVGIEALPAPEAVESKYEEIRRRNKEQLDKSTEAFEKSDILRTLREKTDANKEKNRRALQDRYCYRQAELGVGDCAGLKLIPGATKSGKQETPEWLKGVLRKLGRLPPEEASKSSS